MGEDALATSSPGPIFACHVAVVSGRSAPGQAVAPIVGTHSVEAVTASQFSLEVVDVRQLNVRHRALIVVAILVEPRNRIRTRPSI